MKRLFLIVIWSLLTFTLTKASDSSGRQDIEAWMARGIAETRATELEKEAYRKAAHQLRAQWRVAEWPRSSNLVSSIDVARTVRPFIPSGLSPKRIGSENDFGVQLQWVNTNGVEITVKAYLYDEATRPQYRLLEEMDSYGNHDNTTVSVSEFSNAVYVQTPISLALGYKNAYIRLVHGLRYRDRGEAEVQLAGLKPMMSAIYEELRRSPTEPIQKDAIVEAQITGKTNLTVGVTCEVTFKPKEKYSSYRLRLDNMNDVQKRGVTSIRRDKDGTMKATIKPKQPGRVEFAFAMGNTNGYVRYGSIFVDVAEGP